LGKVTWLFVFQFEKRKENKSLQWKFPGKGDFLARTVHNEPERMENVVMTVREAARFLRLSETIVRRRIKQRHIPFLRVGNRYLLYRNALEQWIEERIVYPQPEITSEAVELMTDDIMSLRKGNEL